MRFVGIHLLSPFIPLCPASHHGNQFDPATESQACGHRFHPISKGEGLTVCSFAARLSPSGQIQFILESRFGPFGTRTQFSSGLLRRPECMGVHCCAACLAPWAPSPPYALIRLEASTWFTNGSHFTKKYGYNATLSTPECTPNGLLEPY